MGGSKLRKTVGQKWAFTRDIGINMSFHPQRKSHKKFELRTNHTWTNNAVKNTNWSASSKHLVSQVFNFHQNILCLLEKVCVEKNEDAQVELSTVSRAGFPGLHLHCTSWCVCRKPPVKQSTEQELHCAPCPSHAGRKTLKVQVRNGYWVFQTLGQNIPKDRREGARGAAGRVKAFFPGWVPGLHSSSQSPVTLVPGDLPPSSGISGHCMYVIHIHESKHFQPKKTQRGKMITSYPSYSLRRERDLSSWLLGPLLVL